MSLSLIKRSEVISTTAVKVGEYAAVSVDTNLTERRIYLFVDTISTGDFILLASVLAKDNQGNVIADFDASLYNNPNGTLPLQRSVGSLFSAGGSAVGDSYVLDLAQPFSSALPQVVLQPLRVNLSIATLSFRIDGVVGLISGFRAWLGCLSTAI